MYNMTKQLWVTGKTYIMEISLCVLKGCLVWLILIYMAAYWWRSLEIGKQVFTDIKSMPTFFQSIENDCLSVNWKGINFDIFVVKNKKYNVIMISTKYGLVVREGNK